MEMKVCFKKGALLFWAWLIGFLLALNTAGIANAAVTYDVTGFGADNSGATLATAAFQTCIDAVNAAGGGVANAPAGTYLIGTIVLKSGVTLNLAQGATLKISTNPADLQANPYDPIRINAIRADGAVNIGITGPGVIDVQGDAWRASNNWLPGRPNRVIMPALCDGVTLKDFSVINSCGWTINPVACDNVTIDGVTVKSLLDKKMDDGIDLESCRHVEVNRVWVEAGDDAITIKTGAIQNPGLIRSSYDINIHDSYFFSNTASALKIGNENQQPIYDVTYSNIAIGTQHSGPVGIFGIACNANRGADIYNISYTNIVMNGVKRPIGISETKYDAGYLPPDRYGNAHDITLENITVTDALGSSFILAAPNDTIDNITLKNVNIHTKEGLASIPAAPAEPYANAEGYGAMPAYGIYARRVNGLRLLRDAAGNGAAFYSDVSDARPAVQFVDCANLDTSGLIDDLGFVAIQEDFNSGTTGSAPLGWTASGTAVTVENLPSATDKSLRIYDNSLSASMFAQKTFVYRSSDTVVEYQVMLPRINGTEALSLRDAAGANAITVAFDPAGNIYTYDGGTKTTVQSYTPNTWYTIKITARPATDTFDLEINGTPKAVNKAFRTAVTHLNNLYFSSATATTGEAYYDNIKVEPVYLVNEDFNAETSGSIPSGWTLTTAGGTVTVAAMPSGTDQSLKMYDHSTSTYVSAAKDFTAQTSNTVFEYRAMATQANAISGFSVRNSTTNVITVAFDSNGYLYTYDGAAKINLQTYEAGTWYTVKIIAKPGTGRFDAYINGQLRCADFSFRNAAALFSNVYLNTANATTGTVYYDNIKVSY